MTILETNDRCKIANSFQENVNGLKSTPIREELVATIKSPLALLGSWNGPRVSQKIEICKFEWQSLSSRFATK